MDYKCTKIRNERNLQWVELEANNAFQGNLLQSTEDMIITPVSIHFQSAQWQQQVATPVLKSLRKTTFFQWKQLLILKNVQVQYNKIYFILDHHSWKVSAYDFLEWSMINLNFRAVSRNTRVRDHRGWWNHIHNLQLLDILS